jgi:hypothetical protein
MLLNPLGTLHGEAVQRANEHHLKVLRLRNMGMSLEKNYGIIIESLTLIVQADDLLARGEAFLQGGHANRTVRPMLREICDWLQVAKGEAIEWGKMANSSATGLHKEWLYKELLDLQRQWLSILLSLKLSLDSLLSIN